MKHRRFIAIAGVILILIASFGSLKIQATGRDYCNETFEYTKTHDFADARVKIDFENSDQQIDVTGKAGYVVTEVALEVSNDGFPGFHVYATGNVSNFNPPGSADINAAKIKVKKVCPSPTVTPTITPTAIPTPTDEPEDCEGGEVYSIRQLCLPTLTPTPTEPASPSATPEPGGNPPTFAGSSTDAPSCSDTIPGGVPNIFVESGVFNDGKLEVRWLSDEPRGSNAHIRYSEDDGLWRYGVVNIENDGIEEIAGLINGQHYWFQVAQVNGCAVGPWSRSFDPLP